jgi:hypothetical protein
VTLTNAGLVATLLLLGISPANPPYVAQKVATLPANDTAPRDIFIPESVLRQGPGLAMIGHPTLTATALAPWNSIVNAEFHGVNPLPQVSPHRMILKLQLSYKGNDEANNSTPYDGNVTLSLDAATGRVLSYQIEGTVPSYAAQLLTMGPCPSFLADSQVDTNIDPEIPDWMHKVAHDNILGASPCLRNGLVTGVDPSSGRFWSNRISEVRANEQEHAGTWKWIGATSWQAPSGAIIPSPHDPLRMPLMGTWGCTDGQYTFGPAGTGHFTDKKQPNNSTDFIYAIADLFAYQVTFVRIGFGHNGGDEYAIAFDGPVKLHLRHAAFYNALDRDWAALPTQDTLDCTRAPKPPPAPSA